MFEIHTKPTPRRALYCSKSGTRVQPTVGLRPPTDTPVAIAVFDHGSSVPVFGDMLVGREPMQDHRVLNGECKPISIDDPSKWISRSHILLRVLGWQIAAIDLGSVNGTQAETEPGTWKDLVPGIPFWLDDGQSMRLGVDRFTVHHVGS